MKELGGDFDHQWLRFWLIKGYNVLEKNLS
jgi:hypothetical protein